MPTSGSSCVVFGSYQTYLHTVASPRATEERALDEMGQSGGTAPDGEAGGTEDVTPRTDWSSAQAGGPAGPGWTGPGGQAVGRRWAPDVQHETPVPRQPAPGAPAASPWSRQAARPSSSPVRQAWSDDLGGDGSQRLGTHGGEQ